MKQLQIYELAWFLELLEDFVQAKIADAALGSDVNEAVTLSRKREALKEALMDVLEVEDDG